MFSDFVACNTDGNAVNGCHVTDCYFFHLMVRSVPLLLEWCAREGITIDRRIEFRVDEEEGMSVWASSDLRAGETSR